MKKILIPALVLAAMAVSSCDDAIDRLPKDKETEENYFKTATDLELFTNPLFNNILPDADDVCKGNPSDQYIFTGLCAELKGGSDRSVPASGGGWTWTNLRRINDLLTRVDRCEDEEAVLLYSAISRYFRAYFYYEKVARFGNVPWIDTPLGSADDQLYAPRDSRETVMQRMLEDIDFAIANLPVKEDVTAAERPFRATKGAALALKVRFCLFEGTFRKYHNPTITVDGAKDYTYYLTQAADAAEKLMSGNYGKYALYNTGKPNEDYLNLFAQDAADPGEYIIARSYREVVSNNTHDVSLYSLLPTHGKPGYTRKFVCTYLMKDGTRFTDKPGWQTMAFIDEVKDRDPRLAQTMRTLGYHFIGESRLRGVQLNVSSTGYQPVKWVQDPAANNGLAHASQGKCTNDIPAFRYAEVLLSYAEAKAELGTLTQGDLDKSVNLVRERAGMPGINLSYANANPDPYLTSAATGFPNVNGDNQGVILEIRRERGIELVQEGLRWNDLMRWKAGYAVDQSLMGMYIPGTGNYDFSGNGKIDTVIYGANEGKPTVTDTDDDVAYYQIGKDIVLTDGNSGYVDFLTLNKLVQKGFNENRDYLYPIPSNELSLNPSLGQNPGW